MSQPQVNLKVAKATMYVECFLNTEDDPVLPENATEENLDLMERFPGIVSAENLDGKRVEIVFEYDSADELSNNFQSDAAWAARFLVGDLPDPKGSSLR